MPLLTGVSTFFDKYILGYALGRAAGPALEPFTQDLANLGWEANQVMPPSTYALAPGITHGTVDEEQVRTWAHQLGYNDKAVDELVKAASVGPGTAEAFNLYNRGALDDAGFRRALEREGMQPEWIDALAKVRDHLLSPAEVANAVQQGHMPGDGILPSTDIPGPPYEVPLTQIDIDPVNEAGGSGISYKRLQVQANLAGLPPPQGELLQMWNRGLITEASVDAGIREGHTKTKWTEPVKKMARRLLTPVEYVDAHLRGYISEQEMYAGTALHGITQPDTDILFKSHGRPLTIHQITTGEARGGVYDGPTGHIPAEYLASLQEGSIKPPWYNLAYANRYTLPSFFVLRVLIQDKTLTPAEGAEYFKQLGWPPDLATQAADAYGGGTATAADTHASKASTQLWTATHRSYIAGEIDEATARAALTKLGVTTQALPQVLDLWNAERALIRSQLSPKEVVKAVQGAVVNPATGLPWTQQEGIDALLARGYTQNDAEVLLAE